MTDETHKAAPPTPIAGLMITLFVILVIAGWILLGTLFIGITSFFASFLFLWYWAAVEEADLKQWPQCAVGAFAGLALAFQSHWLAGAYGTPGAIASLLVIIVAVYVQIMNWLPLVINRCAMLFLTVLAAPIILDKLDPLEMSKAIGLAAIYFGGIIKLVSMLTKPKAG